MLIQHLTIPQHLHRPVLDALDRAVGHHIEPEGTGGDQAMSVKLARYIAHAVDRDTAVLTLVRDGGADLDADLCDEIALAIHSHGEILAGDATEGSPEWELAVEVSDLGSMLMLWAKHAGRVS